MSRTKTLEQNKLNAAEQYIESKTKSFNDRIMLIEAASAVYSGANVFEYWESTHEVSTPFPNIIDCANELSALITATDIPYALAISALAREPITIEAQKENGVFYTDYRLAIMIAKSCRQNLNVNTSVSDLAAGTGILISAIAMVYKEMFPNSFEQWLESCVFAFDLSQNALRGAAASLLALSQNTCAVVNMQKNWKVCDSLIDPEVSNRQYDILIGNPPWGKIKISRHAFLKKHGEKRTYGEEYGIYNSKAYEEERQQTLEYSKKIKDLFNQIGTSEADMYMAFLQKALASTSDNGKVAFLIPAGLIRSKGTLPLREYLLSCANDMKITLLNNKTRFFAIDTRFKFLMLTCIKKSMEANRCDYIELTIPQNASTRADIVSFDVKQLRKQRPDLTVPEVRDIREKELLDKLYLNGRMWGNTNDEWFAEIVREIDMTNDKGLFVKTATDGTLAVVEGRMVQQHRFGAKAYISGNGRSATWHPCANGCNPQFYIPREALSEKTLVRSESVRVGYCDIAGQTNERAMMSAIIPKGVVCGNKVPTIVFPNDKTGNIMYLWTGITNSFVFDWMIRRIISTTVNFFVLLSIPMPNIEVESETAGIIISATKELAHMKADYYSTQRMQMLRCQIDIAVAEAYGLSLEDMEIVLQDFPLIDRKQPKLDGKADSITKDLILSGMRKHKHIDSALFAEYHQIGANAYIPAEMIGLTKKGGDDNVK